MSDLDIITKLRNVFDDDNLTDCDLLNYAKTITSKIIQNGFNAEQLTDDVMKNAVIDCARINDEQTKQLLGCKDRNLKFGEYILNDIKN